MGELRQIVPGFREVCDSVALRQWSVVSWQQLRRRALSAAAIDRAVAAGRLRELHHGVYSTIHPSLLSVEGRLAAAVLAGGDGARLFGATAAWWYSLCPVMPSTID